MVDCWQHICWDTKIALLQVQSTFSSRSWEEHHETWKEHRYEWLPSWQEIPKHLHEALATPHLSKLKVRVNKASQDGDQGNVPLVPSARKCPYGGRWDCLLSVGSSKAKREASLVATCNAGNANPSGQHLSLIFTPEEHRTVLERASQTMIRNWPSRCNDAFMMNEAFTRSVTSFPFQLDSALKRMYNYLQRFAVGLEVMVEDQAMYDGDFIMEFNEAEYKLKAVS